MHKVTFSSANIFLSIFNMIENPRKPVIAFLKPFNKLLRRTQLKLPLVDRSTQICCSQGYTAAHNSALMPVDVRIVCLQKWHTKNNTNITIQYLEVNFKGQIRPKIDFHSHSSLVLQFWAVSKLHSQDRSILQLKFRVFLNKRQGHKVMRSSTVD